VKTRTGGRWLEDYGKTRGTFRNRSSGFCASLFCGPILPPPSDSRRGNEECRDLIIA